MVRPGHRTHDPLPARAILPRDPACRTAQPEGTRGRYERGLVSQTPSHLQRYTRRCAATFLAGTGFCHVWSSRRGEQTPPSAPGRHYLCALPRCLMAKVELRTLSRYIGTSGFVDTRKFFLCGTLLLAAPSARAAPPSTQRGEDGVRWYQVNNQPGQPRPASLRGSWAIQVQRNSARLIRATLMLQESAGWRWELGGAGRRLLP